MRKFSKCPALVVCLCEKEEMTAKVRCSPGRLTREPVNSNSIVTLQKKELTLEVTETWGLHIQNKLLVKCLQVDGGRVSLGDCSPHSALQEWRWLPGSRALRNHHTGECLTAPREQYEGVQLQPCVLRPESVQTDTGGDVADTGREASGQAWFCSKRGHLTLVERGLHLSATQESTLVFLSREHKQPGSRWRTLDNQTLCNGRDNQHKSHHNLEKSLASGIFQSAISDIKANPFEVTDTYPAMNVPLLSPSNKSTADLTGVSFSTDNGMGWKITMLALSSLALVIGIVILMLNVHSNRRKKVVCVLKSYSPRPERSAPGSPVRSDRALLTEHAMRLPQSSPAVQRGEILIEWKDGTVTPLYEA
uniref:Ricin B lectin domain-containing protein n=1 Tax=Gasterosteus aculeatus aculeatus TaxID=481459 RepID=A0AAQ4QY64_GASAC